MKKIFSLALILLCFAVFSSCGKTADYIIKNEPSICGTVVEVGETFITIDTDKTEGENLVEVSTGKIENKDSYTDFKLDDEVTVYYDGTILETYPSQIIKVYLITFTGEAKPSGKAESAVVMPQSIMVGGKIYMSTGNESKNTASGSSGEIVSSVSSEEMPKENNQSNFGTGYKYSVLEDGNVAVNIDGKMIVFAGK